MLCRGLLHDVVDVIAPFRIRNRLLQYLQALGRIRIGLNVRNGLVDPRSNLKKVQDVADLAAKFTVQLKLQRNVSGHCLDDGISKPR